MMCNQQHNVARQDEREARGKSQISEYKTEHARMKYTKELKDGNVRGIESQLIKR
ncbi:hypothetical protein M404DRAFT_994387 [Pisolithus tinctorius Marx 270]|uniref:Uncharacterized protein n=1 Tax=Pisolithus tinctorius Marx 270 TaxID=870435 RepID=A0A0C3PRF7_PISTI|nr:hypothetical protein M404DRAFT_994387 [Pisolithus tinctorius Marx 270]